MRPIVLVLSTLAVAAATVPAVQAQEQAVVAGTWQLQTTAVPVVGKLGALFPKGAVVCEYSGAAVVAQNGASFSGPAELSLDAGDVVCPSTMSGQLDGEVVGSQLQMGFVLGDGGLGEADFAGALAPAGTTVEKGAPPPPDAEGTFTVVSGPFTGTSGTWAAFLGAPAPAIPAAGPGGLTLLALLLAGAGGALLAARRRRGDRR